MTDKEAPEDLGAPVSYLVLADGTPVFDRSGDRVGTVEHVLADAEADVFDGLVISGPRFVDAPEVAEIHERGVLLGIDSRQAESLPEPSENPAALRVDPAEGGESELGEKLRRAWDYIGQKNPVPLRPNSPELFMLALARDEAHRFANRGRKQTGKRRRFESALDRVKGLGQKAKKALLTELGSVEAVRAASDEQLLAMPGVTRRHVDAVRWWVAPSTN